MQHSFLFRLFACRRAAAAAEMALVTPFLIILMFASFEAGNYFLSEHVVAKAVRDGARYASRRSLTDFTCPGTVASDVVDKTRNITRTGQVATGGTARLINWTAPTTVSVTLSCTAISGGNYSGIYKGMSSVPKVKVSATVPYASLFNDLGFTSSTLNLVSESEAVVQGI
ncbi:MULTISPECIES: TadE/TadG family type IV pilus assembly protein [Sphingobium]|uniref:Pilus assembly protein TadE n=1 Tax=Sphingobium chungbukense TaxID=56193 RepID=A0A0M3AST5_9SPHN|nr:MULTISPECIES: TadE/TadG family type IV pilus assembly protein [Sphingobium]KKW92915.1 pilus assembly protein TadE [Sphingobium chungbukense]PJG46970.1 pilus assembly protein TadE [Sphingobium sp. LB126]